MILTCPSCGTRYQVDSAWFSPNGRNVRCAKCSQVWFQESPGAQVEPEPELPRVEVPSPEPPPVESAPAPGETGPFADEIVQHAPARPARSTNWATVTGWLALVLTVAVVGLAIVQYRAVIATFWPQSASFYALIGLPVNVRGLAFSGVTYSVAFEDGEPVLAVSGTLANVSASELAVPPLRVDLFDGSHRSLYHWTFNAGATTLASGDSVNFLTRLSNPPRAARDIEVTLADAADGQ